MMIEKDIVGCM